MHLKEVQRDQAEQDDDDHLAVGVHAAPFHDFAGAGVVELLLDRVGLDDADDRGIERFALGVRLGGGDHEQGGDEEVDE